jgi:leader peptidase (prepilin peptidase)/N-methyltransferase
VNTFIGLEILGWSLLGLIIGSFCNVVISRLPIMMLGFHETHESHEIFNLAHPRSHCPSCLKTLRAHELIPLLSQLRQRGRCLHCQHPISLRYPCVELLNALAWGYCAFVFLGMDVLFQSKLFGLPLAWLSCTLWSGFFSAFICLAFIDHDHHLLPDAITQPMLWLALLSAQMGLLSISLDQSLWGATLGYLSLACIAQTYAWFKGQEGMGRGDMKLLAVMGAILGPLPLVALVLMASVLGLLRALWSFREASRLGLNSELPFGSYLILAFALLCILGPQQVLHWMGLGALVNDALSNPQTWPLVH